MRAVFIVGIAMLVSCTAQAETCIASVYWPGDGSQRGTVTASGIPLRSSALMAAHKTRRLRSNALVTNLRNGKSIEVQIVDRGPYVRGRCIDLTRAAAAALGFTGLAPVTVE